MSPQHFAQATKDIQGTGTTTNGKQVELYWNMRKGKLTIQLSKTNNVATFYLAPGISDYSTFCKRAVVSGRSSADTSGMMNSSQETMHELDLNTIKSTGKQWNKQQHQAFENASTKIQSSFEDNAMNQKGKAKEDEYLLLHEQLGHIHESRMQLMVRQGILPKKYEGVKLPFCSSCAYGKSVKRNWRSKRSNNRDEAKRPTKPGECISVDQLISPTPGLIAQMTGRLTTKRYSCATVYVDQYSSLSFVWPQVSTSAEDTIKGKVAFENYAQQRGVRIEAYHADNGVFRAHQWVDHCTKQKQILTYAGVGAHHQNGVAERRIRVLQEMTRTLLLHAQHKWPQAISPNLWPYTLRAANAAWIQAPNPRDKEGLSPKQRFCSTRVQPNVKHAIPFGCPSYVLESQLQSRLPFHKWKSRARVGIYLGKSPVHARNIALIMDKDTGLVSPQFHVRFDKAFDTVKQEKIDCKWKNWAGFVRIRPKGSQPKGINTTSQQMPPLEQLLQPGEDQTDPHEQIPINADQSEQNDTSLEVEALQALLVTQTNNNPTLEIYAQEAQVDEDVGLCAMQAHSDPDTMYHHEAMRQPDKQKFKEDMDKERQDQCDNGNFEIIPMKDIPDEAIILPAVWQMRRKRDVKTGTIRKYKARLNIDGSRMKKGRDYDLTYAPVATWNAIRLVLTMVILNKWHTVQLDYVAAFPQAPIDRELFMHIPRGVMVEGGDKKDFALRVKRNLYGQK